MKKKEYTNISAKLIEFHNTQIVPFLRELKSSSIKIRNTRTIKDRNRLEDETFEDLTNYYHDFTIEYLILNKFILDFISKEEYEICINLIKNADPQNKVIGATMIYNLVEAKKEEIKNKLKCM